MKRKGTKVQGRKGESVNHHLLASLRPSAFGAPGDRHQEVGEHEQAVGEVQVLPREEPTPGKSTLRRCR